MTTPLRRVISNPHLAIDIPQARPRSESTESLLKKESVPSRTPIASDTPRSRPRSESAESLLKKEGTASRAPIATDIPRPRHRSESTESLSTQEDIEEPPSASKCFYLLPLLTGAAYVATTGAAIHAIIHNESESWETAEQFSHAFYALSTASAVSAFARVAFLKFRYSAKAAKRALRDSFIKPLLPEGIIANTAIPVLIAMLL